MVRSATKSNEYHQEGLLFNYSLSSPAHYAKRQAKMMNVHET